MNNFKTNHKKVSNLLRVIVFTLVPIILFILITSRSSVLFGLRTFTVLTGSMEPKIHVGSIILTAPTPYKIGDIISFTRENKIITHRIVDIKNGQFITKGDANKIVDSQLVSISAVIGKDYLIIPYIGKLIGFIKTIPGFTIFIVVPTIIYIGLELQTIKNEIERQTEMRVRKQYEHTKG